MAQPERKRRAGARLRLRPSEALAAASAVALFVLLFLPWYEVSNAESKLSLPESAERTAWEALEVGAPLTALVCALVLGIVLVHLFRPGWKPAIAPGAAVAVLGGVCTLGVLGRIGFPPDIDGLVGIAYEATPTLAAFFGLAAAFGIAVGGYRAMRAEGSSFAAVADSLQPRRARPASRKR